jgi:hypothetical protein
MGVKMATKVIECEICNSYPVKHEVMTPSGVQLICKKCYND